MADPGTVKVLFTQALAAQQLGEYGSAERAMREALRQTTETEPIRLRLMDLLMEQGKSAEARRVANELLYENPRCTQAWYRLAQCELDCGEPLQALACAQRATQLEPREAATHGALGGVLYRMERYDAALEAYDHALQCAPDAPEWLTRRGMVLRALGLLDAAERFCAQALRLAPESAETNWNTAIVNLTLGNYRSGWEHYEWRWFAPGGESAQRYGGTARRWRGEPVAEKCILLWGERGLGDVLQFCRYAFALREHGASVVLQVPATLAEVVRTLDPGILVVAEGEELPPHDLHAPLLSVPHHLQAEHVPARGAYLHVPPHEHRPWHTQARTATRPRVGLMWQGGREDSRSCLHRSMPAANLAPLLLLPCDFVALACEISEADRNLLGQFGNFKEYAHEIRDFGDTASLIDTLDLVISVDTSVAHLAGALGRPTWLLLPRNADWRWGAGERNSVWYPGCMRLFRQQTAGNWESVIGDVLLALDEAIRGRSQD